MLRWLPGEHHRPIRGQRDRVLAALDVGGQHEVVLRDAVGHLHALLRDDRAALDAYARLLVRLRRPGAMRASGELAFLSSQPEALFIQVGDLYANRETTIAGATVSEVPMSVSVEKLLQPFRIFA